MPDKKTITGIYPRVDCDFPGGNILVDKTDGNRVFIKPDMRDTSGKWFYWCFRAFGGTGQRVEFEFSEKNLIGTLGPAVSLDQGETWSWIGESCASETGFSYTFTDDTETRFSMGMPYTESNLKKFIREFEASPFLKQETLCRSRKGRPVELLRLGRLDGQCRHRVTFNARHHCCEMMASYALEGIMKFVLENKEHGKWLRENVEFSIIPFVDKDGVEAGDQGKNRRPHDHNRDYAHFLYPETMAISEFLPDWSNGRCEIAISLHCPMLRGTTQKRVYFVGAPDKHIWQQVQSFSKILETSRSGPLPFKTTDNLPFGEGWNTTARFSGGTKSFGLWSEELPGIRLAGTLEIPYAQAHGIEINAETARLLGHDLARAAAIYLKAVDNSAP